MLVAAQLFLLSILQPDIKALKDELQRTKTLKIDGYPAPYFVAFALEHVQSGQVSARFGKVLRAQVDPMRSLYSEIRVGDYDFDNTAGGGEPFEYNFETGWQPSRNAPLTSDPTALRTSLWLLADDQYKAATTAYLKKKADRVHKIDPTDKDGAFSREKQTKSEIPTPELEWDNAQQTQLAERLSKRLSALPHVFDHEVQLQGQRRERALVTSEGTELVHGRTIYAVQITGLGRTSDGVIVEAQRAFYAASPKRLPSLADLERETDAVGRDVLDLSKAQQIDPYTGPAILAPEAAGVLFHEALGHRLEGERQKDQGDGQTFKGQIGQRILPAFVSVYDDPTMATFGNIDLNGHYAFDDEGVPAERVTLVEAGILKSFLLSRTPVEGAKRSNGHGRAEVGHKPRARMATTIVTAAQTVPYAELKKMLIAEAKKQKKPYGLLLKDVSGGQTSTETGGYQAFKGSPRMVYTVDVATGKETLVRGVEMVGTPLTALSRVVAASNEQYPFNGYCGAESGYVPVSTLAPALLLSEIELQRTTKERTRAPLLPRP